MIKAKYILYLLVAILILIITGCAEPLIWPESPLYEFPQEEEPSPYKDMESAMEAIVGHYAHYNVVAYVDDTTETPMNTFIISYGFTDFFLEDGKLYERDCFVHAEQKINQANVTVAFSDGAVQAIEPRVQPVELELIDGQWHLYRPPTPTLLGIKGDSTVALSHDPNDPNIVDSDGDGKPGVTVTITIANFIKGEIYITRREIFAYHLQLYSDGRILGYAKDDSEQFVIDASMKILSQGSNAVQHRDYGLSPVILVPLDESIDTAEELMGLRDELFPPEPAFK